MPRRTKTLFRRPRTTTPPDARGVTLAIPASHRPPEIKHPDGWVTPPPATLADGTLVQLLKDGEALHVAYRAIEDAQHSVDLETYIFKSDDTGREFADLLIRRAKEGINVRVLFDSIGSLGAKRKMFRDMLAAGVVVREFHPPKLGVILSGRVFTRDHRKLLVVDRTIGVLGGQNLGDEYGSSWITRKRPRDEWRDTGVAIQGPSARVLAIAFERMWNYVTRGGKLQSAELFCSAADPTQECLTIEFAEPPRTRGWRKRPPGPGPSELAGPNDSLQLLASAPTKRGKLQHALRKLLRDAQRSIDLSMAYFAPPEVLVQQLCNSAAAGVKVRLMLPSRSDVPILVTAARAFYERLLAAGVEVYERQHAVLHAKTLCVDGVISIVGSANLDERSMEGNAELSVAVNSQHFADQLRKLFEHDITFSRRIVSAQWRRRPFLDRVIQAAVLTFRRWL